MKNIEKLLKNIHVEIAKRLKIAREEIGHTQVEMAKNFNISKQIYNNIEQGKRRLQIEEVAILKYQFNIDANWLFFGEGSMKIEDNMHKLQLSDLILDFREYGGDAEILTRDIIKKILEKFYTQEKFLFLFKKKSHKYGNRPHYILIKILKSSTFNGCIDEAKNWLRNKIEKYHDKSPFLKDVKKELYSLLENINNKDCYYLLINPIIAVEEIKFKEKILKFDMKVEDFFYGDDLVKIAD